MADLLLSLCFVCLFVSCVVAQVPDSLGSNVFEFDLRMKNVTPTHDDEYLCSSYKMPSKDSFIVRFQPLADANTAHHIIMYGCSEPYSFQSSWGCTRVCKGPEHILFAWAKNAPDLVLPDNVGFRVGGSSNIQYIVIQVHYAKALPASLPPDTSGIRLFMTSEKQRYEAGIFLLLAYLITIPPGKEAVNADISCTFEATGNIYPFGYRTHAHSLGRVITGYTVNNRSNGYVQIGKGNPQWPQSFYPVGKDITIMPGDKLLGRCVYNSTSRTKDTFIGATANDEMCNFYIMYYKDPRTQIPKPQCVGNSLRDLAKGMPFDSYVQLPRNATLEAAAHGGNHMGGHGGQKSTGSEQTPADEPVDEAGLSHYVNFQSDFNKVGSQGKSITGLEFPIGQVGGVATSTDGNVYVFHRGRRVWGFHSFDINDVFVEQDSPIDVDTVIVYDKDSQILRKFGKNMFYMPHGIAVDKNDNVWVTDVALHQVMRFPKGQDTPDLVLGTKFKPGNGHHHFCKPTDVGVMPSGEFFVSDGYCNNRIVKFSKEGKYIKEFGFGGDRKPQADGYPEPGNLFLPHSLAMAEDKQLVCVADRENGRIQCFDYEGNFVRQIHPKEFGPYLYAIEYCPLHGGLLFAVNGPARDGTDVKVQGFIININNGDLSETWNTQLGLKNPHDVTVDPVHLRVYVGELDPPKVWRFDMMGDNGGPIIKVETTPMPLTTPSPLPPVTSPGSVANDTGNKMSMNTAGSEDLMPAIIIGCLLVIPVIIIVVVVIVVRVYKKGEYNCCGRHRSFARSKFNLGDLLSPHRGFDRLSTEESGDELDLSDSDQEEYSITQKA